MRIGCLTSLITVRDELDLDKQISLLGVFLKKFMY